MPLAGKKQPTVEPVPVADPFVEKEITVETQKAGFPKKVRAKCVGALGVHPSWGDTAGLFEVTSLTTGRAVVRCATVEDARLMAVALWEKCRVAFSQPTVKQVIASLSPWMMWWINTCDRKGKYLDPEPFRRTQRKGGGG